MRFLNMIKERKQLECLLSWVLHFGRDGRVWVKVAARRELFMWAACGPEPGSGCLPGTMLVFTLSLIIELGRQELSARRRGTSQLPKT